MLSKEEGGIEGVVVLHMMYRTMDIKALYRKAALRHLHYFTTAAPHP